ncbi:unnamed protein product [Prorocentrum cordatum]|uniref:Uncharacterized protein n=1 Tax=Prorocentrum cordatum TaxID=2364126 RepID=A0ABN9PNN6_9DINO|nr:unnamed protein product [Polarella glacialis]
MPAMRGLGEPSGPTAADAAAAAQARLDLVLEEVKACCESCERIGEDIRAHRAKAEAEASQLLREVRDGAKETRRFQAEELREIRKVKSEVDFSQVISAINMPLLDVSKVLRELRAGRDAERQAGVDVLPVLQEIRSCQAASGGFFAAVLAELKKVQAEVRSTLGGVAGTPRARAARAPSRPPGARQGGHHDGPPPEPPLAAALPAAPAASSPRCIRFNEMPGEAPAEPTGAAAAA